MGKDLLYGKGFALWEKTCSMRKDFVYEKGLALWEKTCSMEKDLFYGFNTNCLFNISRTF